MKDIDKISERHPAFDIYNNLDYIQSAVVIATELPREEWPFNGRNWFLVREGSHWEYLNELNEKNSDPNVKFKWERIEVNVLSSIVKWMEMAVRAEIEREGWAAHEPS